MAEFYIVNETVAFGDTLNSFPAVMAIIKAARLDGRLEKDTKVPIVWLNPNVGSLFPYSKYNAFQFGALLDHKVDIAKLSLHDAVHARNGYPPKCNFIESSLIKNGLGDYYKTIGNPEMEIEYPEDNSIPTYDFVIAPYKLNNAHMNMTPQFWQNLVNLIIKEYGVKPCVIGSSILPTDEQLLKIENYIGKFKDPQYIKNNFSQYLENVEYFFDQPLTKVAKLLDNVKKCFISVDSGPSHLMAIIKRPHIELFPNTLLIRHYGEAEIRRNQPVTLDLVKGAMSYIVEEK